MTMGLLNKAKLVGLFAGLAILAAACATEATGENSDPTATSTAEQNATQQPQDNENTEATATAVVELAVSGQLFLQVDSPSESETFVTEDNIELSGHTTVDAMVSVNDSVVEVDASGKFAHTVQLDEGPNYIEVVVSDADGQQHSEGVLVIYEPA